MPELAEDWNRRVMSPKMGYVRAHGMYGLRATRVLLGQKSSLIHRNIIGAFDQSDFWRMDFVVLLAAMLVSAT